MAVFLVNYDLVTPGQNYDRLTRELTRVGGVRAMLSTWVVEVDQTAESLRNAIATDIDLNDRLLIIEIVPSAMRAGHNLIPPAAEWLTLRAPGPSSR